MAAYRPSGARVLRAAILAVSLGSLAGCGHLSVGGGGSRARDCMARVMYFESIRSSDEGMLAVGTVVMNRVESDKYPNAVCAVVGQKNQFAPGALTRSMKEGKSRERAYRIADQVLRGKRHKGVGKAMFFHTAGRTYRYTNMHYVAVAGGNAFYERKPVRGKKYIPRTVIARAGPRDSIGMSRWPFGRGYTVEKPATGGHISAPAAPVYVAAAPQPRAAPARAKKPLLLVPPESIEALILASNGY